MESLMTQAALFNAFSQANNPLVVAYFACADNDNSRDFSKELSIAMVLDYLRIKRIDSNLIVDDRYFITLSSVYGIAELALRRLGVNTVYFIEQPSLFKERILIQLENNKPVIAKTNHWFVIIGYDPDKQFFIVHDPCGVQDLDNDGWLRFGGIWGMAVRYDVRKLLPQLHSLCYLI